MPQSPRSCNDPLPPNLNSSVSESGLLFTEKGKDAPQELQSQKLVGSDLQLHLEVSE